MYLRESEILRNKDTQKYVRLVLGEVTQDLMQESREQEYVIYS